jgi:hypothetical protein
MYGSLLRPRFSSPRVMVGEWSSQLINGRMRWQSILDHADGAQWIRTENLSRKKIHISYWEASHQEKTLSTWIRWTFFNTTDRRVVTTRSETMVIHKKDAPRTSVHRSYCPPHAMLWSDDTYQQTILWKSGLIQRETEVKLMSVSSRDPLVWQLRLGRKRPTFWDLLYRYETMRYETMRTNSADWMILFLWAMGNLSK